MPAATAYPHLEFRADGTLRLKESHFKVIVLLEEHVYGGWDAEKLVEEHPPLTLGEAHALLSYYYDNREAVDREIRERLEMADRIERETRSEDLQQRLRDLRTRSS